MIITEYKFFFQCFSENKDYNLEFKLKWIHLEICIFELFFVKPSTILKGCKFEIGSRVFLENRYEAYQGMLYITFTVC